MSRKFRVYRFTRRDGSQAVNTTRLLYPFRDMQQGDHFTVRSAEVVTGNLINLASTWGKLLKVKFTCRTIKTADGESVRVTRTK